MLLFSSRMKLAEEYKKWRQEESKKLNELGIVISDEPLRIDL